MATTNRLLVLFFILGPSAAFGQATKVGPGAQVKPEAATPGKEATNGVYWVNSAAANAPYYTNPAGTPMSLAGGNETLAQTYALGTAAADQTMSISAGDGGPVICKANAAATGTLFQTQANTGTPLVSLTDNGANTLKSAAADGASAVAAKVDTTTAWSNLTAKLQSWATNGTEKAFVQSGGFFAGAGLFRTDLFVGVDVTGGAVKIVSPGILGEFPDTDNSRSSGNSSFRWSEVWSVLLRNTGAVSLLTSGADGAGVIASSVDTTTAWSNITAKLTSWKTNGVEKAFVQSGGFFGATGYYSPNLFQGINLVAAAGVEVVSPGTIGIFPDTDVQRSNGTSDHRWTETFTRHLVGGQSAVPTCTPGTGAGAGGTCAILAHGTDLSGTLEIVSGTLPAGSGATIATITLNAAQNNKTACVLSPDGAAASLLALTTAVYVDAASGSTTTWVVKNASVGVIAGTLDYAYTCTDSSL